MAPSRSVVTLLDATAPPPPAEPPQEDPGDFTADQAYTEGTVLQLLFG